jgi:DNA polymerase V
VDIFGGSSSDQDPRQAGASPHRLERRLAALGITTVAQLAAAEPVIIRDWFNVVVMRAVLELQGIPCIPFEQERIGKEQPTFSRSFSQPVTSREGMRQVLSVYVQQGAGQGREAPPGR